MTEIDPQARALLDLLREQRPSDDARKRMRARLAAAGVTVVSATAGQAAAKAIATGASGAAKTTAGAANAAGAKAVALGATTSGIEAAAQIGTSSLLPKLAALSWATKLAAVGVVAGASLTIPLAHTLRRSQERPTAARSADDAQSSTARGPAHEQPTAARRDAVGQPSAAQSADDAAPNPAHETTDERRSSSDRPDHRRAASAAFEPAPTKQPRAIGTAQRGFSTHPERALVRQAKASAASTPAAAATEPERVMAVRPAPVETPPHRRVPARGAPQAPADPRRPAKVTSLDRSFRATPALGRQDAPRTTTSARPDHAARAPSPKTNELTLEAELLGQALVALSEGRPKRARELLDQHEKQFAAHGRLSPEREHMRQQLQRKGRKP